ncbi:uncharacterized protein N7482_007344 [Penicillium canariense]|uniref:Uncharacterized protein n=1 Tax=Penicillium canariense TaxID=189055 RepID=A0A9W9LJS1_9EURO|nr:uncharacterized protein N7482_007344 [Penicillium canariense]KAJ5160340.1 hypothetical protein N7482_007344 [Penicillium canariense]
MPKILDRRIPYEFFRKIGSAIAFIPRRLEARNVEVPRGGSIGGRRSDGQRSNARGVPRQEAEELADR